MLSGMRMGQPMSCCPRAAPPDSLMAPWARMGGPEAGGPQVGGPAVAASAWAPRRARLLVETTPQGR